MRAIKIGACIATIAAFLCGCMSMATDRAMAEGVENCAASGEQFILDDVSQNRGLAIWTVTVRGRCVGPDDPGYVPPEEYVPPTQ